jgi:HK97 gp10 family phage protein
MSNTDNIKGLAELQHMLKTLPGKVQRKVTRKAMNAAANPIVKAAKLKAPSESDLLKQSIGKKVATGKTTGSITAIIGPRRDVQGEYNGEKRVPANYAHLVELGTEHSAAEPFLRPAFDEQYDEAAKVMAAKMGPEIEKEAKKLAGGSS